jgi:hypothetical protein
MKHNPGSIGRGQQEWRGERSVIVFSTELIGSRHEDKLGFMRCLVWRFVFEGAIFVVALVGWSLWNATQ